MMLTALCIRVPSAAQPLDTVVLLMGGRTLPRIVEQLQRHGRGPDTPVAVVRAAATEEQAVWRGTLGSIVRQTEGVSLSPCIDVVGQVTELPFL
jgi:uroporphyrinogen III methyltransferase/synthase